MSDKEKLDQPKSPPRKSKFAISKKIVFAEEQALPQVIQLLTRFTAVSSYGLGEKHSL